MAFAKLRNKGQITIPDVIRKAMKASAGDMIDFQLENGKVVLELQKLVPVDNITNISNANLLETDSHLQKNSPIGVQEKIAQMKAIACSGASSSRFESGEDVDQFISKLRGHEA